MSQRAPKCAHGAASLRIMIATIQRSLRRFSPATNAMRAAPTPRCAARTMRTCSRPLLLVHGYNCSRGVWWLLRRQLEAAGHTVATVSLAPPYTNIGKLVPRLAQRIENVCRATGADRVVLVAHSMGGLVCRSYLARHGSDRVERLITIASPHSGSELARIGIGKNAREMEPGSLWLKDLAQAGLPVPAVAIRTPHDNFVMPQDNQRLPGAIDVALEGIGHLAVLFTRRTTTELIAACR